MRGGTISGPLFNSMKSNLPLGTVAMTSLRRGMWAGGPLGLKA